ncbi:AB hydrolase-1 domain-containing protein [Mycena indigotica]|uniref:AB hydrolase-1 domain-containing protein n=1 Tax=Mycena indigotica TaxID=2126181 RepID=A0A8H6SR48_9AGAR|nr:AB hydrolase-1 domain-containing protein [Mycena indigotica]KAF7303683.1 AB hydrolase-1 domain-containing protein [Mycena indigotica]
MASATIPQIDQNIHFLPSFTLECGTELKSVPVAYKTWGRLNETKDNVMVICHALTGSADVEDWWGPLMGRNKAFDPSRFFIFCANTLGSPYGSASPITTNPDTGKPYGPTFPPTSIRDDVKIHQHVLRTHLGVRRVAVVIGGSMGGMATLEWPLIAPGFVQRIVVLATSARHSAWCIAWGESQRQSIYSDPAYKGGYYEVEQQPRNGLAAARMTALLTYRSRDSFERRFGRKVQAQHPPSPRLDDNAVLMTPPASPPLEAVDLHNDGHRAHTLDSPPTRPPIFSAQSYLRYQGDKFIARFDANCYIHITRKMDTHDLARGRVTEEAQPEEALVQTLSRLPSRALVISIQSDGLFTPPEQALLATHIPDSELVVIPSGEGHDGFLVEFEEINHCVLGYLQRELADMYSGPVEEVEGEDDFAVKKESVFGEAEVDLTRW